MKNFVKKISLLFMLLLFSTTLFFSSCKKEEVGEPPEIPPEGAFVMDFNSFKDNANKATDATYVNWTNSVFHVGVWNIILTVSLAVPVAVYVEALKQTPQHHSGKTWLWEYSVKVGLTNYTAQLYGIKGDNEITWEMYISQEGGIQEFPWYTGTHNLDATEGKWIIRESLGKDNDLLQIDWTRNNTDSTYSIKYTNIVPGGAENGGYIAFSNQETGDLDAYYDIYNKGKDELVEIEWNTDELFGRIRAPHIYSDEIWHCWNTDKEDTDCGN